MNFEQSSASISNKELLLNQIKNFDFLSALNIAIKISRLGGGQTAVVWKMETTINNTPFQFARKIFQSGKINQIIRERDILTKLKSIDGVPTLLQATDKFLDIELIRGIPLGKLAPTERRAIPKSCVMNFFHTLISITAQGAVNSDLNVNNILYDPLAQKLTLVDFGGAVMYENTEPKREQLKYILLGLKKLFPGFQEFDNFYQLVVEQRQKLHEKK